MKGLSSRYWSVASTLPAHTAESRSPPGGSLCTVLASCVANFLWSAADCRTHSAHPSLRRAQFPAALCHMDTSCPRPAKLGCCSGSSARWTAVRSPTNGNWSVCLSADCFDPSRLGAQVAGCTDLFASHKSERVLSRAWLWVLCVRVVGLGPAVGSLRGYSWVDQRSKRGRKWRKLSKSFKVSSTNRFAYNFRYSDHIIRVVIFIHVVVFWYIIIQVRHILVLVISVSLWPRVCCPWQHTQPRHADHNDKFP